MSAARDRRSTALADADTEVRDCADVLHVLGVVLAADTGPLDGVMRDALATVARLGRQRAEDAAASLDEIAGGARGHA